MRTAAPGHLHCSPLPTKDSREHKLGNYQRASATGRYAVVYNLWMFKLRESTIVLLATNALDPKPVEQMGGRMCYASDGNAMRVFRFTVIRCVHFCSDKAVCSLQLFRLSSAGFPCFSRDVDGILANISLGRIATRFSRLSFVDPQILTLDIRRSKNIARTAFSPNDTRF